MVEKISQTFNEALEKAKDYNEFVFFWLNHFFKDYGLLVVNMDDKRLKKSFSPIIKKEILERKSVLLVQDTQEKLLGLGFKPQAFARDINVFYMSDGSRERIYFENDRYIINNTNISFSESEILVAAGFGRYGTPDIGEQPRDGNARGYSGIGHIPANQFNPYYYGSIRAGINPFTQTDGSGM